MADTTDDIQQGVIGFTFAPTIVDVDGAAIGDISDATVITFRFAKPTGVSVDKTGVFYTDGTDSKLKYVTVSGDMDVAGAWKLQCFVTTPTWSTWTSIYEFDVQPNLTAP